jgi:hypothetical protein
LPDDAQSFYLKVSSEGQEVKNMIEKRMGSSATSGNYLIGLILIFQHVLQATAAFIVHQSNRQMINMHITTKLLPIFF